jgi:sugar lactone lactonase YvrE
MDWKAVKAEPDGLLDFSRTFGRLGPAPDCILAKTVIPSDKDQIKKYLFGYSDEVTIFLNGTPLFTGDSTYRYRDPSFLGIAGLFDALYLPLKKGDNELLFLVTENMGGWGLILQDATAVYSAPGISEAWKTPADFLLPETAVYDPASRAIYVSGYDAFNRSLAEGKQYVSKLSLDGKIEKLKWAEGLKNPAGMAVTGGKLYVAEPASLAEVDIASGKLLQRYPVAGAMMLNDLAAGPDGSLYISDSRTSVIYKFSGGKAEEWLSGAWIARPNGMHISGNELLVGNNGDGCLKGVDLSTKAVRTIADLGQGIIDGIEEDGKGNVLVSHNEGRLFRVAPSGEVTKLLDTTVVGQNLANFAYLPDRGLLVIPTWIDSRVVAYTLDAK